MPAADPEFVCPKCQTRYAPRPKSGLELAGAGVMALAGLAAIGMLLLIKQGDTAVGGASAAAAMLLLGLGMWLQKRGRRGCPACETSGS
jgi:hypothetical protein